MSRLTQVVLVLALVADPVLAQGRAHVHGQGTLDITAEAGTLTLYLKTPAHNLLGFERKPRNAGERAAVEGMVARLRDAGGLYVPSPQARCRLSSVRNESPVLDKEGGEAHQNGHPAHQDLVSEAVFLCERPEHLRSVQVRLFDAFRGLRRLDVQTVSPRGQSAARLSPGKSTVDW